MKILQWLLFAAAAAQALAPSTASAQAAPAFPTRTVTLVVPFTANSGSDIISRIISPRLSALWKQPVIVDNRPGASGTLGANQVARATPDGHTLLMMINTFTTAPSLYKNLPFDPINDFTPVAKLAEATFTLAVNSSLPVKDMASLFAYAKQNPGKLNYASPGNGTPQHLAMEVLKSRYDLNMLHVPYKGIAGAFTDLAGGQVQLMLATVHSAQPVVSSGRVRLIAINGAARNPLAPNVATFREQGVDVMDGVDAWYGVMAPAHTPPALVERLNRDFLTVMNAEDTKAELAKVGLSVHTSTPAQLGALVKTDLARWRKVITDAKITAD